MPRGAETYLPLCLPGPAHSRPTAHSDDGGIWPLVQPHPEVQQELGRGAVLVTVTDCPVRFESGVRRTRSSVLPPQGPRTDPAALGGLGQPAALWGDPGGADAGCQARGAACGGVCPCPGHRALVDPTWIPPSSSGKPSGHPSRRASAGRDPLSSSGTTGSWGVKGLAEESRMLGMNLIHARRHQALVGS